MFKTLTFARWSRKAQVSDKALVKAITEMAAGLIDADLGGSVYKKRVPLPGRGKSGGARILVATRYVDRWFLLYGFGKNEQASIDDRELAALQKLAAALLSMTSSQLEHSVAEKELMEIVDEEKPNPH
ncbi:MAG TPA: type II toxin-antitoxin system RelE/ParE family toxin [Rhizomicrobium sp.]|nr:type II toxin-antitoxin system RelE/ParE family toxin [Rhizomicrobium sp.]